MLISEEGLSKWLLSFKPMPMLASRREKVLSCLGAFLGLVLTERLSSWVLGAESIWFIAPMGASAVLLFGVPSSPLAQPWSIMGGNVVSAVIGVTCALLIPNIGLAAGVGVGLAIGAMFLLRCVHPPSGAVALTAVLGGPAIAKLGYGFVLFPVAANSLILVVLAVILNSILGRRYPHSQFPPASAHKTQDVLPSERLGFTLSDLELALKSHGELLAISTSDLASILSSAEILAHRRRFGDTRCHHIMSKDVIVTNRFVSGSQARQLMLDHKIKALPVVNDFGELEGIVTLHDFILGRSSASVEDLMTSHVITAAPDQPLAELVALFSDGGLHHLPVIDSASKVIGIITQSDVVAALFQNQLH